MSLLLMKLVLLLMLVMEFIVNGLDNALAGELVEFDDAFTVWLKTLNLMM